MRLVVYLRRNRSKPKWLTSTGSNHLRQITLFVAGILVGLYILYVWAKK